MDRRSRSLHRGVWTLASGATGASMDSPHSLVVAAVQFSGTWGGATAKLQISNDETVWFDAVDKDGDAVSATANAIFELSSAAMFVRAVTTGGNGTTAVVVTLSAWNG